MSNELFEDDDHLGPYERPSYLRAVTAYELDKRRDLFWLWLARRLPRKLAYWSYIVQGSSVITDDEVVPEVRYAELLKRMC